MKENWRYLKRLLPNAIDGGTRMNANETLDIKTTPDNYENHEIANMDEFDFLTLLMESRIIQAS